MLRRKRTTKKKDHESRKGAGGLLLKSDRSKGQEVEQGAKTTQNNPTYCGRDSSTPEGTKRKLGKKKDEGEAYGKTEACPQVLALRRNTICSKSWSLGGRMKKRRGEKAPQREKKKFQEKGLRAKKKKERRSTKKKNTKNAR